jgi:choline/glycine/proline betaine transport protein
MKGFLQRVSPVSFFGASAIALFLIAFASLAPDSAAAMFDTANAWIIAEAGWFYLLAVGVFVIFLLSLALSPLGRIKLGPDDATPDYGFGTWVAMLFSGGMGIGIVFYGVAEPITHFAFPPDAVAGSPQAARDAMEVTFFHWGVHAWAIYAVVGLALAYFGYRRGQPLLLRSAFRPILGRHTDGLAGDLIDIFAVVGTLAGLATSLGLGVSQLNASMNYLFGLPQSLTMQLWLIAIVTLLATATVATGLDNGIRRMSELIILVSFLLMFLVLALGPTEFLLRAFVENIGLYLDAFVSRTFHIYAYEPTDWVGTWTLFYWGWWISWSPFVGMFIARISRGRTIRQFLCGVLFAPAGFSFIWFTIFGDTAIWLDTHVAGGEIARTVADNMPVALFTVFDYLPWATFLSWLTGLLVAVYFVTASDAGALVIAMITSRGEEEPVLWLRVGWALACGAVAGTLLLAGGLSAVQMAAVIAGLPLAVVMLLMCYGIWKALREEVLLHRSALLPGAPPGPGTAVPWRRRLAAIVSHPTRAQAGKYLDEVVAGALARVAAEMQERGLAAEAGRDDEGAWLRVVHEGAPDFLYAARPVQHAIPAFALADAARREGERARYWQVEVFLAQGGRGYDIYGYDAEQVIADALSHYNRFRHFLYASA